jgi:hypothetical protein
MKDYNDIVTSLARDRVNQQRAEEQAEELKKQQLHEKKLKILGPIKTALDQLKARWAAEPYSSSNRFPKFLNFPHRDCQYEVAAYDLYSAFNGTMRISVNDECDRIRIYKIARDAPCTTVWETITFLTADEALPTVLSILADQMRHR